LNKLSKAARASAGVLGFVDAGPAAVVDSRATVTVEAKNSHWFAASLGEMRTGIGFKHWKRVEGSKWLHCLQQ
jgi:hypothetical protein